MSKKRLEEIKNTEWETSQIAHINWLIEQAERVQELEGKHKEYVSFVESNNHSMDADLEKLYKQNKHYREALIYVTKAHIGQYHDFKNMLEDIKFVVNKTLEGEE